MLEAIRRNLEKFEKNIEESIKKNLEKMKTFYRYFEKNYQKIKVILKKYNCA